MNLARARIWYLFVATVALFALLGHIDLIRTEPILVLGGKHMLQSGQWLVPRLYGEVYANKPAMPYWMAAVASYFFGDSEFALRAPTALCGLILGWAVVETVARFVSPRAGLFAGVALVTNYLFLEQARTVGYDTELALGVGVALLALCHNLIATRASLLWWLLGYGGLFFGLLSKGLPAVFVYAPSAVVAAFALGRIRRLFEWKHLLAAAIFVGAVIAFVIVALKAEGPIAFWAHLEEIASRSRQWGAAEVLKTLIKPIAVFVAFLPWSLASLLTVRTGARAQLPEASIALIKAAWCFAITGIALFMMSATSNTRYYLPLATPMALLASAGIELIWRHSEQAETRPLGAMPLIIYLLSGLALATWVLHVTIVEPNRAKTLSQRSVAEAFEPFVPADQKVRVDTQDSYSSLFHYLHRPVRFMRLDKEEFAESAYVVLTGNQVEAIRNRPELLIRTLATSVGGDRKTYTLALISRTSSTH